MQVRLALYVDCLTLQYKYHDRSISISSLLTLALRTSYFLVDRYVFSIYVENLYPFAIFLYFYLFFSICFIVIFICSNHTHELFRQSTSPTVSSAERFPWSWTVKGGSLLAQPGSLLNSTFCHFALRIWCIRCCNVFSAATKLRRFAK